MEEGRVADPGSGLVCATILQRLCAAGVDLVVNMTITVVIGSWVMATAIERRSVSPLVAQSVVWEVVWLVATQGFMAMTRALTQYGGSYEAVSHAFSVVLLLDSVVILFNRRRRSVDDYIAGTYVVTRESWARVAASPA